MKGVWQVFYRELRDQLRDRRTLFMAVVLPVLLYPALGLGALQMALLYREKPRTVVLLGSGNLPADPPLLENGTFAPRWFDLPTDAGRLQLVTDAPRHPVSPRMVVVRNCSTPHGESGSLTRPREGPRRGRRSTWPSWKRSSWSLKGLVRDSTRSGPACVNPGRE